MGSENLALHTGAECNTPRCSQRESAGSNRLHVAPEEHLHFDIRRENEVRISSTQFCGGTWRWRLCSCDGTVLAASAEYQREEACRAALAIVRRHAGTASFENH